MHRKKISYLQIDEDFNHNLHNEFRKLNHTEFQIHFVHNWQINWKIVGSMIDYLFSTKKSQAQFPTEIILLLKDDVSDFEKVINEFKELLPTKIWSYIRKTKPIVKTLFKLFIFIKTSVKKQNRVGLFNPAFPDSIWILKKNSFNGNQAIISHEHIHLLQAQHPQIGGETINTKVLNPEFALDDEASYFLNRHEVEARLHEMLIAYDRVFSNLPVDIVNVWHFLAQLPPTQFVFHGLWLQNEKELNQAYEENNKNEIIKIEMNIELMHKVLGIHPETLELDLIGQSKSITQIDNFREPKILEQFEATVYTFLDEKYYNRFTLEVLPIMYCNLLLYYGYEDLSQYISQLIPRPNLYDFMYAIT